MKFAFKKELMYFSRTFRMFGVIFAILIISLFDPLMYKGMLLFMDFAGEQLEQSGFSVTEGQNGVTVSEGEGTNPFASLTEIYDSLRAPEIASAAVSDFTSTSALILFLVLMQPAGGEQKKRSTILPLCAGLTPIRYIVPKFVIYPLTAFLSSLVALPLCAGISVFLFGGEISFINSLAAGAMVGLYLAFLIVIELTLGICTARPGLAAIFTILGSQLLPTVLALFRINRFNPFVLPELASGFLGGEVGTLNLWVSVGVTVVIGVILFFTTLLTQTARRIDNSGNEPVL